MTEITLTLKVKDVEIKLSTQDAKELYEALGKLVGEKVLPAPIVIEKYRTYPWWPYYQTWYAGKVEVSDVKKWETIPMWESNTAKASLSFSAKG